MFQNIAPGLFSSSVSSSGNSRGCYDTAMLLKYVLPSELEKYKKEAIELVNKKTAAMTTGFVSTGAQSPIRHRQHDNTDDFSFKCLPDQDAVQSSSLSDLITMVTSTGTSNPTTLGGEGSREFNFSATASHARQHFLPQTCKRLSGVSRNSTNLALFIPRLIEDAEREGRDTRTAMQAITGSQVAAGKGVLSTLSFSEENISQLSARQMNMTQASNEIQHMSDYDDLRRLHYFHKNVASVLNWAGALRDIHKVNYGRLLEKNKILLVYNHVKLMEEIRIAIVNKWREEQTAEMQANSKDNHKGEDAHIAVEGGRLKHSLFASNVLQMNNSKMNSDDTSSPLTKPGSMLKNSKNFTVSNFRDIPGDSSRISLREKTSNDSTISAISLSASSSTKYGIFEPYITKQNVINMLFITKVHAVFENTINIAIEEALCDENDIKSSEFEALKQCVAVCEKEVLNPIVRSMKAQSTDKDQVITPANFGIESPFGHVAVMKSVRQSLDAYWSEHIMTDTYDIADNISLIKQVEPMLATLELVLLPLNSTMTLFAMVVQVTHSKILEYFKCFGDAKRKPPSANTLIEYIAIANWYKTMLISWGLSFKIGSCMYYHGKKIYCLTNSANTNYNHATGKNSLQNEFYKINDGFLQSSKREPVVNEGLQDLDNAVLGMLAAAVGGMQKHMSNAARGCAIQICKNIDTGIKVRPMGTLYTNGPVDLFVILQQSLATLTANYVEKNIMKQLGYACCTAIETFLSTYVDYSKYSYWQIKYQDEHYDEGKVGELDRGDWMQLRLRELCAFLNDLIAIHSNMKTVEIQFVGIWERILGTHNFTTNVAAACSTMTSGGIGVHPAISPSSWEKGQEELTPLVENVSPKSQGVSLPATMDQGSVPFNSDDVWIESTIECSPFINLSEDIMKSSSEYYLNEIAKHVEQLCASTWSNLFVFGDWYNNETNPLHIILDTITDFYKSDFAVLIEPILAAQLLLKLMRRTVRSYMFNMLVFLYDFSIFKLKSKHSFSRINDAHSNWLCGGGAGAHSLKGGKYRDKLKTFSSVVFATNVDRDVYFIQDAFFPLFSTKSLNRGPPGCGVSDALNVETRLCAIAALTRVTLNDVETDVKSIRVLHHFLTAPVVRFNTIVSQEILDAYSDCPSFIAQLLINCRTDIDDVDKSKLLNLWNDAVANLERDSMIGFSATGDERTTGIERHHPSLLSDLEDVTALSLWHEREAIWKDGASSNAGTNVFSGLFKDEAGQKGKKRGSFSHSLIVEAMGGHETIYSDKYGLFYGGIGVASSSSTKSGKDSKVKGGEGGTERDPPRPSRDALLEKARQEGTLKHDDILKKRRKTKKPSFQLPGEKQTLSEKKGQALKGMREVEKGDLADLFQQMK